MPPFCSVAVTFAGGGGTGTTTLTSNSTSCVVVNGSVPRMVELTVNVATYDPLSKSTSEVTDVGGDPHPLVENGPHVSVHCSGGSPSYDTRSEEHTSELQSRE